jgi:putative ABC transport system permease protein
VSASGYLPAGNSNGNNFMSYPDVRSTGLIKTLRYEVDYNYIQTLGMQMGAGRNFSRDYGSDSSAVIVNETAVKAFGWGAHALGHTLSHTENDARTYNPAGYDFGH